jgi:hypothetical protein
VKRSASPQTTARESLSAKYFEALQPFLNQAQNGAQHPSPQPQMPNPPSHENGALGNEQDGKTSSPAPVAQTTTTSESPVNAPYVAVDHVISDIEKVQPLSPAGCHYLDFLRLLDSELQPKAYFEIGTNTGMSVRQFSCKAVCVDPDFCLETAVMGKRPALHLLQMTSDVFFAEHDLLNLLGQAPDICFLDGMHRAEYLLNDFKNTEKLCNPSSIILLHDCLPTNERMTLRFPQQGDESEGLWRDAWTGDVWKLLPILKEYRPDLNIFVFDCFPTGLVAVTNLSPESSVLAENHKEILKLIRTASLKDFTIKRLWKEFPIISSHSLLANPGDLTLFLK